MSDEVFNLAAASFLYEGNRPEVQAESDSSGEDLSKRVNVSMRLRKDVYGRAKRALRKAGEPEGLGTIGELVEQAIVNELKRLEDKYNEGTPYEPLLENLPTRRQP